MPAKQIKTSYGMLHITPRQYDVLIRLHKSYAEIAQELGITRSAVDKIYFRIRGELNCKSRAEVLIKALKYGLVDIEAFKL